jgi:hypothetical protein
MKKIIITFALLLCGLFSAKSNLVQAYSVDSSGGGLVPNVLEFKAIPGDQHVALSWINPETSN